MYRIYIYIYNYIFYIYCSYTVVPVNIKQQRRLHALLQLHFQLLQSLCPGIVHWAPHRGISPGISPWKSWQNMGKTVATSRENIWKYGEILGRSGFFNEIECGCGKSWVNAFFGMSGTCLTVETLASCQHPRKFRWIFISFPSFLQRKSQKCCRPRKKLAIAQPSDLGGYPWVPYSWTNRSWKRHFWASTLLVRPQPLAVKGCSQNPGYQGKKLLDVFFLIPSNIKQPHIWSKNDMWKSMEIPNEKPHGFLGVFFD